MISIFVAVFLAQATLVRADDTTLAAGTGIAYSVLDDIKPAVLYSIRLDTGQVLRIGTTGFDNIEGLAFGPDGVLYGVDTEVNRLVRCNLTNGSCTSIGFLGITIGKDAGLAFDCAGNLWLACEIPAELYKVNPQTGVATFIGPLGQKVTGLGTRKGDAICASGVFALGGQLTNNLGCIETTASSASRFRTIGFLGAVVVEDGGLDFDANGVLWGIQDNDNALQSILFTIDPSTGAATSVFSVPVGFESLAIDKGDVLCNPPPPPPPPPSGRRRAVRLDP